MMAEVLTAGEPEVMAGEVTLEEVMAGEMIAVMAGRLMGDASGRGDGVDGGRDHGGRGLTVRGDSGRDNGTNLSLHHLHITSTSWR
jgi:hypothetical protein